MQTRAPGYTHFRIKADGTVTDYHGSGDIPVTWDPGTEVVGSDVSDLVPPYVAAVILEGVKRSLATKAVVDINYTLVVPEGERAREARLIPVGGGEVLAVVGDVTERRTADARRMHLAEILEASTDYVATTDLEGQILYANDAFQRRFGVDTIDDMVVGAHNLFDFLSPESRQRFITVGVPVLWKTGHWSGEIEAIDVDGATMPLWQAAIVHLDPSGKPEYFSGISRDITEMKTAVHDLRVSEERFRALVAESSDVILVLNAEGIITYASPAFARLLGYPEGSMIGTSGFELIHPDDVEAAMNAFIAAFTGENAPHGLQYRVRHQDGSWRWTESHTTNHLETPGVNGYIVNARDITARHDTNELLKQAADLLASVMGAAGKEAIMVTDKTGTIVAFSRGAELLLGYSADEVIGKVSPIIFHVHEDVEAIAAEQGIPAEQLFIDGPPNGQSIMQEWVFVRRDGSRFEGMLNITGRLDSDGQPAGFVAVARDVTEERRHEAELVHRADYDQLTGLANRAHMRAALHNASAEPSWDDPGRVILYIDLDHFKDVNDRLGHAAGDSILMGVADRLRLNLRVSDLAARIGGDEFIVLLGPTMFSTAAADVAQRIVRTLAVPFPILGTEVTIGASVGMATSGPGITPKALALAADTAAYSAKHAGRGRVVEALP
jgi:diguanylate cyclase (GGDEF)-like protein/PAS domain S-box-containing protein